jgi:hypothetical protein
MKDKFLGKMETLNKDERNIVNLSACSQTNVAMEKEFDEEWLDNLSNGDTEQGGGGLMGLIRLNGEKASLETRIPRRRRSKFKQQDKVAV